MAKTMTTPTPTEAERIAGDIIHKAINQGSIPVKIPMYLLGRIQEGIVLALRDTERRMWEDRLDSSLAAIYAHALSLKEAGKLNGNEMEAVYSHKTSYLTKGAFLRVIEDYEHIRRRATHD